MRICTLVYIRDIDVGNVSGGNPEYGDDLIEFDKENNFLYFYDDGISTEWPNNTTGQMGVSFLRTPVTTNGKSGITDMHYNLYFDDEDQDTIQYGIMSSSESLKNSALGSRYFHLGDQNDIHFDDPSTIPDEGLDIVATISSGPYNLAPGDTLTFVTAIIAGETNDELYASLEVAKTILRFDFDFSKPPVNSNLSGIARDSKVHLYWDDAAEKSYDKISQEFDFEGYRVYRSEDNGVNWKKLAEYDKDNLIGNDTGLRYSFVDSTVTNGFEYWYSVTAYDRGNDLVESLESAKGNTVDAVNLVSLTPQSNAIGRIEVSAGEMSQIGATTSNFDFIIDPVDDDGIAGNLYEMTFEYIATPEVGFLDSVYFEFTFEDSTQSIDASYTFDFNSLTTLSISNLVTGDIVEPDPKNFRSGSKFELADGNMTAQLFKRSPNVLEGYPTGGERIRIQKAMSIVRNNADTLILKRPFQYDVPIATPDGVTFQLNTPSAITDVSRIGGTDVLNVEFGVDNESNVIDDSYVIRVLPSFTDNNSVIKVPVSVTNSSEDIVFTGDLEDGDEFIFNGIYGAINFNDAVVSGTNIFAVTTEKPRSPTLLDKYVFTINGSSIEQNEIAREMGNIKVVPNPYVVSSLYEPEFGELRREPLRQLQFINLPNKCAIYIFSVDADLVKTLYHDDISGTETWNLRAEGGREIAAGIYMYVVKTENEEYKSRFAIIK
jgi:hypothetical protein